MFRKFNRILGTTILAAAATAALPTAAKADHRDFRRDEWRHDRDWHHDDHGHFDIRIGDGELCPPPVYQEQVWVAPVYRTVTQQVWVPASYATVVDHVWVDPVVQRTTEHTWVPDRYELRDVTRWENGQRVTTKENVLVEAGHYADVPHDVVVTPGHYEDRPRQQLVDAHYETVTRQEVVVPGHYEVVSRVAAAPVHRDGFSVGLRIPIGH